MNFRFLYSSPDVKVLAKEYEKGIFESILELEIDYSNSPECLVILSALTFYSVDDLNRMKEILNSWTPSVEFKCIYDLLLVRYQLKSQANPNKLKLLNNLQTCIEICAPCKKYEADFLSEFYILKSDVFESLGMYDDAIQFLNLAIEYKHLLDDYLGLAECLNKYGNVMWRKGNLSAAKEKLEEGLKYCDLIKNLDIRGAILSLFGNLAFSEGNLEEAELYFKQSLDISSRFSTPIQIAFTLNNYASVLSKQGKLSSALQSYLEVLDILNSVDQNIDASPVYNNIGTIYHKRGQLSEALDYFNQSLEIRKQFGDPNRIALALHNIGEIYIDLGDYKLAEDYLKQALNLRVGSQNSVALSDTLYQLIILYLKSGNKELANKYFSDLKILDDQSSNKIIEYRKRLGHALILKESSRIREKIQAADIFKQLISEPVINHQYTLTAMKGLYELLLLEYKTLKEDIVMNEIEDLIREFYLIANNQHSSSLLVETHVLKARLKAIQGDFETSKKLLETSREIIANGEASQHLNVVTDSFEELKSQFEYWSSLVDDNLMVYSEIIESIESDVNKLKEVSNIFDQLGVLPLILSEYKGMLHPIKLTILKILFQTGKTSRSTLLKILNINSGSLEKHIKQLTSEGFIGSTIEIIDESPRKVLFIEPSGRQAYRELQEIIKKVVAT